MKNIKSFKLFESSTDNQEIASTVEDMIMELDFYDIDYKYKTFISPHGLQFCIRVEVREYNTFSDKTKREMLNVFGPITKYLNDHGFRVHISGSFGSTRFIKEYRIELE